MSTSAQRRLLKDLQRIQKQQGEDIMATPQKNNLLKWTATIEGADGTPWEGGLFQLKLDFTEKYPNKPPHIKFISEMFHPNIYNDGRICLDMLQNQWSPIYDIWSVLTAIRSLLADPNTLSPANMVASDMFTKNKNMYEQKVREIVEKSLQNYKDEDEFLQESKRQKEGESPVQLPMQNYRPHKKESQPSARKQETIVPGVKAERNNNARGSDSEGNEERNSSQILNSQQIVQDDDSFDNLQGQGDEEAEQNQDDGNQDGQEEQQDQNNEQDSEDGEGEGQEEEEHEPYEEYQL